MEYQQLMKSLKYRNLYKHSYSKELGRLAQGIPDVVKGTNTIFSSIKRTCQLRDGKTSRTAALWSTNDQRKATRIAHG